MKPRITSSRRRWGWVALAVALACGVVFVAGRSRATSTPIDTALVVTVQRRSLEVEVLETGRIQPREKVDLKSKIAGQVSVVLVKEGKTFVLRVLPPGKGDKAETRTEKLEITQGLRNDREVEITSGVSDGMRVLLRPASAAENETKL